MKRTWQLSVFLLPAVCVVILFNYLPMSGVLMAFQRFNPSKGIAGSPWVGLTHFQRFFNSYNSVSTITNTVILSLLSLIFSFPAPILLAVMLNQMEKPGLKKAVQTVTYLPYFISIVVLVSLINLFLSPQRGLYGVLMNALGVKNPVNPITDPACFRPVYIISAIWQTTGYQSIIYLASLSAVDPALHEAAMIDGANKFQRVLHVDIPTIIPTVIIMFILACGSLMNVGFEKTYLMQNTLNLSVSEVLQTYIYKVGLQNAQYSFSTAINLFNTLINIFLLLLMNFISRRLSETALL